MSKFKVGDRVRVVRGYSALTPRTGWTGTVRECGEYRLVADWDGHGRRTIGEDMCDVRMVELIEPATDLEARVAALEKLVGLTKAPEYSFGDRVDVLYDGEWRNGVVCGVHPIPKGGRIWCAYEDPSDGLTGSDTEFFVPEDVRPRQ